MPLTIKLCIFLCFSDGSFDYCQNASSKNIDNQQLLSKLPECYSIQNEAEQNNGFFGLEDTLVIAKVNGPRGHKRLLFEHQIKHLLAKNQPTLPKIQALLQLAYQMKGRLDENPGTSQTALAKEMEISRVRVTQILNLLRLAPEIQQYIMAMPPTMAKRGAVTENRLRCLIGIHNRQLQVQEFRRLLGAAVA